MINSYHDMAVRTNAAIYTCFIYYVYIQGIMVTDDYIAGKAHFGANVALMTYMVGSTVDSSILILETTYWAIRLKHFIALCYI